MDTARPAAKRIQALRDQADEERTKQANQQSDAEPSAAPKDDADRQKPDLKDTVRKIETFGVAGIAAAVFSIPR